MIFNIKQNDRKPALRCTLYEGDGSVCDLTGATVKFIMGGAPGAPMIAAAANVVSAADGIVEYPWAATDTANAGHFLGEFQATFVDGRQGTYPNDGWIDVHIRSEIGS